MKILIAAAGSHGDVLPCVALGTELQARGHDVQLFASAPFEPLAAQAGLPFTPVLGSAELQRLQAHPDSGHPRRGLALLAQAVSASQQRCLPLLAQALQPGRTLLVGTSLAWATRALGEARRVPVATLHLAPAWLRSQHKAPSIGPLGHLEHAPALLKRGLWRLMDRRLLDPLFAVPFNALRATLGLPPVARVFHHWMHGADLTLGLFPDWFAPPQPDWPAGLLRTGFPLPGAAAPAQALLAPELQAFLQAGPPPVAFTAGTAGTAGTRTQAFFAAAVQACRQSGRRGLLITQDARQLPPALPATVLHVPYAPFEALLPRVQALVHHGGIGTTSQALRAGVPQLVRPMGFDQFDNARRVLALGVGRQLLPAQTRPGAMLRALDALDASALRSRCDALARRMAAEPSGVAAAADALLALAARRLGG